MNSNEQQRKPSTVADLRAFMLDAVSGGLPAAGAILAILHQAWWLLFFTLTCLVVALAMAPQTARGQSWVLPRLKCWELAMLGSIVAIVVAFALLGLD